ncbi:MAG: choice-of-anchor tandem repeat GloVer-containing protein [Candidatus Sulfotelmatobacter sp.]|jgi:uncharacterized repeat protein (TIGR03803 family)
MNARSSGFLILLLVPALFSQTPPASAQSSQSSTGPQVKEIFQFSRSGGYSSRGALIMDKAGNLYGTTMFGGNTECGGAGCGTVLELSPSPDGTWSETVLYAFTGGDSIGGPAGSTPVSSLVFDSDGNLYGTASAGGLRNCSFGCGTVFKLTPNGSGWTESTLYQFRGNTDGWMPKGNLVFDKAGNIYGTTQSGGEALYYGTVFKLTHQQDGTWTETVLYSFSNGPSGCIPSAVLADANDNIFGVAQLCGARVLWGTIWEISNAGTFSVIHTFEDNFTDGGYPNTGLTIDQAGNLYGGTIAGPGTLCGGLGCGVIYELLANNNWQEKILHSFSGNPGAVPNGALAFDAQGNLWGTTQYWDEGTLFEITPASPNDIFTPVKVFQGPDGPPFAGVIFDSAGNAYGTQTSGRKGLGGVFKMTP